MNRKEEILSSYKILGKSGRIYDSILLRSTLVGKIMNSLMWGFTEETTLEWIEGWQCGIPEGFKGKILDRQYNLQTGRRWESAL